MERVSHGAWPHMQNLLKVITEAHVHSKLLELLKKEKQRVVMYSGIMFYLI